MAETGGVKMVIWDIEGTFFKDDLQNKIRRKTFVFIKDYWAVSRIEQTSILVFSACISFRFGFLCLFVLFVFVFYCLFYILFVLILLCVLFLLCLFLLTFRFIFVCIVYSIICLY